VIRAKTPAVGKDVDDFCTKCNMLLNHVVVAKVGETIKRVKCLTCNTEHAYRGEKAKAEKSAKSAAALRKRVASSQVKASDYDTLMKGRDLSKAKKYKPASSFEKNDVLDHPKFGMGLVLGDKDGSKIDVAFSEGVKTLVHNLQ
jgi:DNA-directed RNA polymerase subunit M/transcription elongation factor TFIIS